MNETQPWYKRIRRWGQTNLTEIDPGAADLAFWRGQWERTRVQGLIVNCSGIVSFYPSRYPMQYRAAGVSEEPGRDYFRTFTDAAREAGLAVVARMDLSRTDEAFYNAHPEWYCRDAEGQPFVSQGRYFTCVNSGYYKSYIPGLLKEIIDRYRPEGFADNNWKGLSREHICQCENCRTRFRADCGLDLPVKPDSNDPAYRRWIRWSYDRRLENWDLFNSVTREHGGEHCLWCGMINADPAGQSGSFTDLKALCERSRIIFCDHQGRDDLNGFEQNSVNGALLRMAAGEDVIVAESMANYVRKGRIFRLAAGPAPETRLWMQSGISGGISPWYHHIGAGTRDRRQFETPAPIFQWHAENEDVLYNRRSLANAALIYNRENTDMYGGDDPRERAGLPWRGFTLALSKGRIPFLPIHADHMERYASRIETIILPDLAALTDTQTDAVIRHLEHGKGLVLTGRTGSLNEDGQPRSNRLLAYLGLHYEDALGEPADAPLYGWERSDAHTYLLLPENRHPILTGFDDTDIIGFGGYLPQVNSSGALSSVAGYIPPFPVNPPEFSYIRKQEPSRGTILAGTLPTGSRVVYFAADIDRCHGRFQLPDHSRLLENAVRWAAGDTIGFKLEGPGHIDVSLYAQSERRVAHLVNCTGANLNPGYHSECVPVGPFTVTMPAHDAATAANLRVSGESIPIKVADGKAVLTIERIIDHEVIVIE